MSLLLLWNVQDVIWQYRGAEVRGVRLMSSGVGEGGMVSVRYAYEASRVCLMTSMMVLTSVRFRQVRMACFLTML
jgi:hypothetical protein